MKIRIKKFVVDNPILSFGIFDILLILIMPIFHIDYDAGGILGLLNWLGFLFIIVIFGIPSIIISRIDQNRVIPGHAFWIVLLGIIMCVIVDYLYRQIKKRKIINIKRTIIHNPMLVFSLIGLILQLFVKHLQIEYGLILWLALVFGLIFSTPNELFLMINHGKAIPGQTIWVYLLGILISLLFDYYYRRNILKKKDSVKLNHQA